MSARSALLALLLLVTPAAGRAEERILQFRSDVQVQPDSSLEVTETIDVRAENNRIIHGIYRDFPTRYRGPLGKQFRVGFTFQGASIDGEPVQASTSAASNGVRIRIGSPDTTVPVGEHRYVIRYSTTRQIGRFKDYDELYWNATGNGWIFPIDVAEARIRLPKPAMFGRRAVYTGLQGSTAGNAEIIDEKPGEIAFRTTEPLGSNEGLTIAAAFPKGVVAETNSGSAFLDWLADNGPPIVGVLGLLGLCVFYYVAWQKAGRNPRSGTVVPIFSPPDGLSPAGMRYVKTMGADDRAFAAALVDMGVRGHVKLIEEEGGWFSSDKMRLERTSSTNPLAPEEEAALDQLCPDGSSIVLEQKNHEKFSSAKNELEKILKAAYMGRLFNKNLWWALIGVALFVAVLWLVAASVVAAAGLPVTHVLVPIGATTAAALLFLWMHYVGAVGKCLASLIGFALAALALGTGFPIFIDALNTGWFMPLLVPLLALPLVISAFWWIAAPTRAGRAVLDRIAGFKQYLSITEQERLERMHSPEDTPELFERYLPYAIALGVENRWADRFQGVLAAAAAQGQQGFGWYSGSGSPWSNPGRFAQSVGSSLASTISSASAAPGSSSGSGGGGSSGGGGGGGGGGGW
jgi:hypothetical protein